MVLLGSEDKSLREDKGLLFTKQADMKSHIAIHVVETKRALHSIQVFVLFLKHALPATGFNNFSKINFKTMYRSWQNNNNSNNIKNNNNNSDNFYSAAKKSYHYIGTYTKLQ